jgi:hypothetical protein
MVEVVNSTTSNISENVTQNASTVVQNATQNGTIPSTGTGAEQQVTTGLLDQVLGPILGLPTEVKVLLVAAGGAIFGLYWYLENKNTSETLDATDWDEKLENMIKSPVENVGRNSGTKLYNRTDVSGKRQIGKIVKLDSNTTTTDMNTEHVDFDKLDINEEDLDKEKEYVSYGVVKGRSWTSLKMNTLLYKLIGAFSSGSNSQAEYFDLPKDEIEVTDEGVEIKEDVKLIKKNGLWQSTSQEAQQRFTQLTWLSTHQHWSESMQNLPEYYSDLNMNISGIKNIENTKSKNMREYKQAEKKGEKKDAMN